MFARPSASSVLVVLTVLLAAYPVAGSNAAFAVQEAGEFEVSQNTDELQPGTTYELSATDDRIVDPDSDAEPVVIAIITRSDRNKGLREESYADVIRDDTEGLSIDIPRDAPQVSYRAIVVSSGFDGQFGRGKSAGDIRALVQENPDLTYDQLEDILRGETVGAAASDDAIEVLRFRVTSGEESLTSLTRQAVVGEDIEIAGNVGLNQNGTAATVEVSERFGTQRRVAQVNEPISEGERSWGLDIDTDGFLIGQYEAIIEFDRPNSRQFRRVIRITTGNATDTDTPELLFAADETGTGTSAGSTGASGTVPDRSETTLVTELDDMSLGETRTLVARVDAVGRQGALTTFTISDGSRRSPSVPVLNEDRTRARVLTLSESDLSVGDWGLFHLARIEDEGAEDLPDNDGELIQTYQALNVTRLKSDQVPKRADAGDIREFIGVYTTFETTVEAVQERFDGADAVYLNAGRGDGTVRVLAEDGDSFAVGETVTVTGRVVSQRIDRDTADTFGVIGVEGDVADQVLGIGIDRARFGREPVSRSARRSRLRALAGYRTMTISDYSPQAGPRVAFNATVASIAAVRGVDTDARRALVTGNEGDHLIVEYPSSFPIEPGDKLLVRGASDVRFEPPDTFRVTPAGIGIYPESATASEVPVTNATNSTARNGNSNLSSSINKTERATNATSTNETDPVVNATETSVGTNVSEPSMNGTDSAQPNASDQPLAVTLGTVLFPGNSSAALVAANTSNESVPANTTASRNGTVSRNDSAPGVVLSIESWSHSEPADRGVPVWLNATVHNRGDSGNAAYTIYLPPNATVERVGGSKNSTHSRMSIDSIGDQNTSTSRLPFRGDRITRIRVQGDWQRGERAPLSVRVRVNETGPVRAVYRSSANRSAREFDITARPTPPDSIVLLDKGYEYAGFARVSGEAYYVYRYDNTNPLGSRAEVIDTDGTRVSNRSVARAAVTTANASISWAPLIVTQVKVFSPLLPVVLGMLVVLFRRARTPDRGDETEADSEDEATDGAAEADSEDEATNETDLGEDVPGDVAISPPFFYEEHRIPGDESVPGYTIELPDFANVTTDPVVRFEIPGEDEATLVTIESKAVSATVDTVVASLDHLVETTTRYDLVVPGARALAAHPERVSQTTLAIPIDGGTLAVRATFTASTDATEAVEAIHRHLVESVEPV